MVKKWSARHVQTTQVRDLHLVGENVLHVVGHEAEQGIEVRLDLSVCNRFGIRKTIN